ncbi:MAG TPA: CAP domain-containing protein [Nocardioides sp.]|nr:CAP domain-containing protein [Nocardioides sp.]
MRILLRSAVAGLTASAALAAAPSAPVPAAHAQGVTAMTSTYETAVLRQINRKRTARGLRALRMSSCIDRFAESRSRRMAVYDELVHYGGLRGAFDDCGGSMVGEVIARGRGFTLASVLVRAWMRSPRHRDVILKGRFRTAGVGAWRDRDGTVYVSVVLRAP